MKLLDVYFQFTLLTDLGLSDSKAAIVRFTGTTNNNLFVKFMFKVMNSAITTVKSHSYDTQTSQPCLY